MKEKQQCKAYIQGTGAYASFTSGEQCKRKATVDGYCSQHSKK